MTLEEFNLAKEFFINKSIDRGYVALEEYNEFIKNMDKDQIDILISDIEKNSLQILSDIEIFQNKLNSNGKKLAFSYYLFVCKVLKTKPSVKEFKPRLVHFQKHLIDVYLCEECSLNEKNIIRLYYGLDSGIPEKNLSNIKELLKYESDSQFINDYHKALSKLENGYVNYYQFVLALESVVKYYSMDTYRFCKIAMEDGEEASMFSPLKNGEEHYGGYYAYYLSDGARQLGWILKPGYFAHNITFYDGDCWGIRTFNERKRPNLNIHYEDGKLYFEFYQK